MGCSASKAAARAVVHGDGPTRGNLAREHSRSAPPPSAAVAPHSSSEPGKLALSESMRNISAGSLRSLGSQKKTKKKAKKGGSDNGVDSAPPSPTSFKRREWGVRPGYSSGASSAFSGGSSVGGGSDLDDDDRLSNSSGRWNSNGSSRMLSNGSLHKHTEVLALDSLRQVMVDQGGLAEAVVRIETPFGKPIEEIYDGVHEGPVLGSGVSGIVRLISHRTTGLKYAVKVLDLGLIDSTDGLKQLRDEIFIMCQLDHPNIVRIEEVYESTNEIYIVQELCLGGDLFDRLDEQTEYHYSEAQCAKLVKQMLSAVRYLHSKTIVHRDLKLENFLFSSREPTAELKMIDFGLSKHFEFGQSITGKVGTPYTVAPEIIRGNYDEKCDIWSLGVITYLLLSGETPFGGLDGENMLTVKQSILRAHVTFEPYELWENVSSEGKAFVKRLLQADPKKRPTAREAQLDPWIQVWAKKDATEGARLNERTVSALMAFKESSDMQKILSEVLSFTLLPEQIVDLRAEFEKIDTDGDGEISLQSLKKVLMENAEAGSLGALTEQEIEDIFDAIRIRKSDPTIRWHEFLAAGLSQAKIDDRNLRLAFDRLDAERKGFITFDDLQDLMGNLTEYDALEKIWRESLQECKAHLNRITFEDFKRLMKGQPKDASIPSMLLSSAPSVVLEPAIMRTVTEGVEELEMKCNPFHSSPELENLENPNEKRAIFGKKRSRSYEAKATVWDFHASFDDLDGRSPVLDRDASRAIMLPSRSGKSEAIREGRRSSLVANRALYRRHREIRMQVLEASKQFDKKRADRHQSHASLIMKRGLRPPMELEDAHQRALFEAAAKRCGRKGHRRNKTKSDVTGLLVPVEA